MDYSNVLNLTTLEVDRNTISLFMHKFSTFYLLRFMGYCNIIIFNLLKLFIGTLNTIFSRVVQYTRMESVRRFGENAERS